MTEGVTQANLRALFNPETIAVIGASDNTGKLGHHVMKSLIRGGFPGTIVPVNPGAERIMEIPAYPSVDRYEGTIDTAVVVLPAPLVPHIFTQLIDKGVKGIVLITAGFKEIDDPAGAELQRRLKTMARDAGIAVIGPNTFGMINMHRALNASFTPEFSSMNKGGVALVSQSGGISHLLGFMAMRDHVGMGAVVGLGNRLTVDFADMVTYLVNDPDTDVIALYIEGIDSPRRLMDAARAARGVKPLVAYKTGSAQVGDSASSSHTGSMAGSHRVYKGAMAQAGILRVEDSEALLDAAKALAGATLPRGPRMAVLSGQAGPGMAACDVCESRGLEIAGFTDGTRRIIDELLPPLALRTNPVDMGPAWYDSNAIARIVRAVLDDPAVDGILLLMMFASANRDALGGFAPVLTQRGRKKPVVSCLVSPPGIWDDEILELERRGALVNFPTPERAAGAMASLVDYSRIASIRGR